jgi:hypothetical protein
MDMKTLLAVLFAVLAVPVFGGDDDVSQAVVRHVLNDHFFRAQPFYAGRAIVSAETRPVAPTDARWRIEELLRATPSEAEELIAAFQAEKWTKLAVDVPEPRRFAIEDLTKYRAGDSFDWKAIEDEFPEMAVVFQISRPIFNADRTYAAVRLDFTKLHGSRNEEDAFLLIAQRKKDGEWEVTRGSLSCCDREPAAP